MSALLFSVIARMQFNEELEAFSLAVLNAGPNGNLFQGITQDALKSFRALCSHHPDGISTHAISEITLDFLMDNVAFKKFLDTGDIEKANVEKTEYDAVSELVSSTMTNMALLSLAAEGIVLISVENGTLHFTPNEKRLYEFHEFHRSLDERSKSNP